MQAACEIRPVRAAEAHAAALAFYGAGRGRRTGIKLEGDGEAAWEQVVFALATEAAALRRG